MAAKKIARKNNYFLHSLIQHFLRKGKKSQIYNVLMEVGELSFYFNKTSFDFYQLIFEKLRVYIELRKVRVRRTIYMVPFPTTAKRQQHLAALWLFNALCNDRQKISFKNRLREELIKILLNKSVIFDKKNEMYKKAEKGRSFMHYRWY